MDIGQYFGWMVEAFNRFDINVRARRLAPPTAALHGMRVGRCQRASTRRRASAVCAEAMRACMRMQTCCVARPALPQSVLAQAGISAGIADRDALLDALKSALGKEAWVSCNPE